MLTMTKYAFFRRVHRVGAVAVLLPSAVIFLSGLLLHMKKEWAWVQPPMKTGASSVPSVALADLLERAKSVEEAGVTSWDDIDRLEFRPRTGVVKVRCRSRWEIQMDGSTGAVLQTAYRRSDLIESIHDGSFFHRLAKLWVFLPAGLVLVVLWSTGAYLFALPYAVRRRRRRAGTA